MASLAVAKLSYSTALSFLSPFLLPSKNTYHTDLPHFRDDRLKAVMREAISS